MIDEPNFEGERKEWVGLVCNCEIIDTLFHTLDSVVFRARKKDSRELVLLKVQFNQDLLEERTFATEYGIVSKLSPQIPEVLKISELISTPSFEVLVCEDIGGNSLEKYWKENFDRNRFKESQQQRRSLELLSDCDETKEQQNFLSPDFLSSFFDLAIKVTKIVHQVHREGVIHGDLKPQNFIYNPITGVVKLTGFDSSCPFPTPGTPSYPSKKIIFKGSVAYVLLNELVGCKTSV
eukprot:TRINITY_DN1529_c0_g1_i1.p2 TRINITY_DN1529_c0_g1~~TRINITY_DN1529_c0_g1_i1.p2  ORF type:complete len:236 (+),score=44.58 TRINITY_DN1529_c0_g1_i1:138-845(+)